VIELQELFINGTNYLIFLTVYLEFYILLTIYINILFALRGMAKWDMSFGNNDRMGEGRVKILEE
jgi:hypothetical protein